MFEASKFIDTNYVFEKSEFPPYYFIKGGVRARLTNKNVLMTKAPLIKVGPETYYIETNHHHTHLEVSKVSGAVLHYKFIGAINNRIEEAIETGEHFMEALLYKALKKPLEEKGRNSLLGQNSTEYKGTKQLVELGLISSVPEWD